MCSVQFLSFNPECLDNAWHFVGRHHGLNMKMPSLPPSGSDVWILSHQLGSAILGGSGNSWRVGQLRVTGCRPLKKTLGSWFLPSTLNLHHKILLHDILPLNTLGNVKPSDQEWNPSEILNPPKTSLCLYIVYRSFGHSDAKADTDMREFLMTGQMKEWGLQGVYEYAVNLWKGSGPPWSKCWFLWLINGGKFKISPRLYEKFF